MHYGTVNDVLDAVVSLSILREDGTEDTLEFIIDTGLSEEMVLPQHVVDQFGMLPDDTALLATSDGRIGLFATYTVWILWHDRPREIHVASMGREFLIGMALLSGSNVNIDAVPGGAVTISELTAVS